MGNPSFMRYGAVIGIAMLVAGCQSGQGLFASGNKDADQGVIVPGAEQARGGTDVENPSQFSVTAQGLWDGRPSLGGIWVAYPGVKEPERVLIRNAANGKSVIGALFRRESDSPGPGLQVSSDAAAALGMLAGAPARLSVVALKREEARPAPAPAAPAAQAKKAAPQKTGPQKPDQKATKPAPAKAAPSQPAAGTPPAAPQAAKQSAGYIQIGFFGVESNAKDVARKLSAHGISAATHTVKAGSKPAWSVTASPADRTTLTKIKGLGYSDAYIVSK